VNHQQSTGLITTGGNIQVEILLAILAAIFWACFATVFYAYLGYPVLIWAISRVFGRQAAAIESDASDLPRISLLIAAYNEETVIEARICNALALEYPPDKMEIVIASDGSIDGTPDIVRRYAARGVRLLEYSRRGKAGVLNAAFPELTGEIVLLSDANTEMDPQSARKLVRWFNDPGIGVVCGRLILTDPQTGRNADSLYWKYETFLKTCEGRLGALLGVNGGIYAIRRELYIPIPPTTIDDFIMPLLTKLKTGCAIVYDREAKASEETPPDLGSEFRRRSRYSAGGLQSIRLLWQLLDPRWGWVAFAFFSHKILRWLCPFCLLGMFTTSTVLWNQTTYRYALLGQVAFYVVGIVALWFPPRFKVLKSLRLAAMFTLMNAALLVGFFLWLGGKQAGIWQSTVRVVPSKETVS
jgi:cellulose synthase/poly-beta-1,6-N-acetylglucosamine synthase-like glycosyltransferase